MNKHQELAINALEAMQGDDLYRMQKYFIRYTQEQMQKPFGASSETTRAQVLSGYEARHNKFQAAIDWVKAAADECYCDKNNLGERGVTFGDCPRDYKHRAKAVLPHADNLPPQGNTGELK